MLTEKKYTPDESQYEMSENFKMLSKEWDRIYNRFKKDFDKLQKRAGGKEKLFLTNDYGDSIYGYRLWLK